MCAWKKDKKKIEKYKKERKTVGWSHYAYSTLFCLFICFMKYMFDIFILLFKYVLKCFKIKLEQFRDMY
jgi:hypothetical protein